jgi:hypothetical protein
MIFETVNIRWLDKKLKHISYMPLCHTVYADRIEPRVDKYFFNAKNKDKINI